MTEESKDKLAEYAVLALLAISLVTVIGGIWAATVLDREIEGAVAVVVGAVGGIISIVTKAKDAP